MNRQKLEDKSKGCGKFVYYSWKNPRTGLYSNMPSHKCGKEGRVLCKECQEQKK